MGTNAQQLLVFVTGYLLFWGLLNSWRHSIYWNPGWKGSARVAAAVSFVCSIQKWLTVILAMILIVGADSRRTFAQRLDLVLYGMIPLLVGERVLHWGLDYQLWHSGACFGRSPSSRRSSLSRELALVGFVGAPLFAWAFGFLRDDFINKMIATTWLVFIPWSRLIRKHGYELKPGACLDEITALGKSFGVRRCRVLVRSDMPLREVSAIPLLELLRGDKNRSSIIPVILNENVMDESTVAVTAGQTYRWARRVRPGTLAARNRRGSMLALGCLLILVSVILAFVLVRAIVVLPSEPLRIGVVCAGIPLLYVAAMFVIARGIGYFPPASESLENAYCVWREAGLGEERSPREFVFALGENLAVSRGIASAQVAVHQLCLIPGMRKFLAKHLPETWRADLEELRSRLSQLQGLAQSRGL